MILVIWTLAVEYLSVFLYTRRYHMFYQYASTAQMRQHAAPYHTPDPISWGHMYEPIYRNICTDACLRQYLHKFSCLSVYYLSACVSVSPSGRIASVLVYILAIYSQVLNGSYPLGATSSGHQTCCAKIL